MELVISKEKPPIYDRLHKLFGVSWDEGIIIAWNGSIHCSKEVWPQKLVHEAVHLKIQNEMGNQAWWDLYCDNSSFRLEQERLAYVAEAKFVKKYVKNREVCFKALLDIATSFSGDTYGNIISKQEALKLIS